MQIWDAAGVARALHELITHNRLAWQLAQAWDKQHSSSLPLEKACEKIRDDWNKMVRLNRRLFVLEFMQFFIILLGGLVVSVASMYWFDWYVVLLEVVFFLSLFMINLGLMKKTREKIQRYCLLGESVGRAHAEIRETFDRFKLFGDVDDVLREIENQSFEIVSREMLGESHENPKISFDSDLLIMVGHNLGGIAELFYEDIKKLGRFGLVTTDLGHHFGLAIKRWFEMVARGEIMTDFQI
jgi:hypothetical protein